MKTNLSLTLKILLFLLIQKITFAQSYIQGYQNIVNQFSQTNTSTNLIVFENFGIKVLGSAVPIYILS